MSLSVKIKHRFSGLQIDLAFEAPSGLSVLFGKSGSGKTTAINAVAGLMRPDWGQIHFAGHVLQDERRFLAPHRRNMGYVFQDARLFPHLSVAQNLRFGSWFRRHKPKAADFSQVVEMLDIAPLLTRRPAKLSGGEKSRVALGRALLSAPDMLLMDEPLAALDEGRKAEILPYLERLRDEALMPILYVTHSMTEVARLANHLILIDNGRVSAQGPVAQVLGSPEGAAAQIEVTSLLQGIFAGEEDGLCRYETLGGALWIKGPAKTGPSLLQVKAQDVILSRQRPEGLSALNILQTRIDSVKDQGPEVLIRLTVGDEGLFAKITARSAKALGLQKGDEVFAILKSVALSAQAK